MRKKCIEPNIKFKKLRLFTLKKKCILQNDVCRHLMRDIIYLPKRVSNANLLPSEIILPPPPPPNPMTKSSAAHTIL